MGSPENEQGPGPATNGSGEWIPRVVVLSSVTYLTYKWIRHDVLENAPVPFLGEVALVVVALLGVSFIRVFLSRIYSELCGMYNNWFRWSELRRGGWLNVKFVFYFDLLFPDQNVVALLSPGERAERTLGPLRAQIVLQAVLEQELRGHYSPSDKPGTFSVSLAQNDYSKLLRIRDTFVQRVVDADRDQPRSLAYANDNSGEKRLT
jgi:hypothetical protein